MIRRLNMWPVRQHICQEFSTCHEVSYSHRSVMAYRRFLLALVTSYIPLIQFAAWTSSLTCMCVGCPKSKLLNNSFKNKLLTCFHSVLSQMRSILNIWWLRLILIFFFLLILWFYCQLVLWFSFSFSLNSVYLLLMCTI